MRKLLTYTLLYPFIRMNPEKYVQKGIYNSLTLIKRTVKVTMVTDWCVSFKVIDGPSLPGTETVMTVPAFYANYKAEPDYCDSPMRCSFTTGHHYRTNVFTDAHGKEDFHEIVVRKVGLDYLYYQYVRFGKAFGEVQIDLFHEVRQYCNDVSLMNDLTGATLSNLIAGN